MLIGLCGAGVCAAKGREIPAWPLLLFASIFPGQHRPFEKSRTGRSFQTLCPHSHSAFMTRSISVVAVALLATTIAAMAQVPNSAEAVLSFDMPYGGCRLSITSNGAGRLAYGALPAWIEIKAGTFEPTALTALLRSVASPERIRDDGTDSIGTVTFNAIEAPLWFNTDLLARVQFRRALLNRLPKQASSLYPEAEAIIVSACSGEQKEKDKKRAKR